MATIPQQESLLVDFNKPELTGKELEYIVQALENAHISGDGPFTKRCQALLEEELDVPRIFLTTSCTHALELAALLMDLQPEDEVIVPAFTFVSTINAFVLRGIRPIFIDIRPDTLNLNEDLLEGLITPRTRVILPVHYAGVACEMDTILGIAHHHHIQVIEDNAHGLFGRYKGKSLGTFGCLSTLSFHETKNITCGEGGALLVNDLEYVERAEILREKGTNRSRFFRGQVDKYTWIDVGSSYLPSDILAAFLFAQLEVRKQIQAKRKHVWEYYYTHLRDWADKNDVSLPQIPPHCEQPYHMFFLVMPTFQARQSLIDHLKSHGILSVFHYLPLHLSKMGLNYGGKPGDCPVTERISDCLIRLPFYNNLMESDQNQVVEAIQKFKF